MILGGTTKVKRTVTHRAALARHFAEAKCRKHGAHLQGPSRVLALRWNAPKRDGARRNQVFCCGFPCRRESGQDKPQTLSPETLKLVIGNIMGTLSGILSTIICTGVVRSLTIAVAI